MRQCNFHNIFTDCRPVIKEKQRFIAMTCDQHEIEYLSENDKVRNDDIELGKNLACIQTYGTDV